MADGAPRPQLYRSVSFKLLERWSGGPGPREGGADILGLRRRVSCRPAVAVPGQPSRRVSKLASGPPAAPAQPRPLRSLSPSVRQLSRRFDAPRPDDDSAGAREGGVSPGTAEEAAEGATRAAWPSVTEMRKLFGGPGSRRPSADSEASGTPSPDGTAWEPQARESRQPPTPPPRTCFSLAGLRSARTLPGPGTEGRRRRQQQQQQQQQERAQRPADGLHSWHNFSQPQAGVRASRSSSSSSIASYPVSRSRAASSSDEEEEGPPPLPPGARSPAYHGGLSSGSEEDQDGEGGHRWGGSPGARPRPGSSLLDKDCRPDSYGLNLGSMDTAGGARNPELPTSRALIEGPQEWGTGSPPCVPGPQEGLRPLSDTVGGAFRVAKVSFPAYLASPSGSRGSSRYSSTETLKDEDLWASRGSGSWGVYRSPSFGAGEGLLRPQARTRGKGPVGTRSLRDGGLELDKNRQRKSLSNPDIASETLTLLNFLRSDLSELRVRKPGGRPEDLESCPLDGINSPSAGDLVGQLGPMAPSAPAAPGTRPTLKDLTATLRRAKSFTCSEKPMARRLPRTSALKPSSSELLLAGPGVEEDPLPLVIQDQYVQEARQVFEKIQRMSAQQDDGSDVPPGSLDWAGGMARGQRSQEELSGPESSLTDEGIGADPEPPVLAFCNLGVKGVWRPLNSSSAQANQLPGAEDSLGGRSLVSPDAPPTPGALRRRRKFPPSGPGGTELSNGEVGEAYRSLSDPIPQRHRAATSEEPSGFSVDSNLLGSLSPKTGLPAAPAMDEGLTSGHSDWSVGSEESKGYPEDIQSIVQGPGALGHVVDDRVAGKTPKKKSLSDPSRRGELAGPGFEGPGGEPIREVEPMLPPSSSEPILAERQAEPEEPSPARGRAQSERALPEALPASPSAHCDFHLDPKLADVLSPRLIRRGSKKRPARSSHQELQREEGNQDQTQARPSSKHVRHASVPTTFMPIMVPEPPTSVGPPVAVPEPMGFPARAHSTLQAPSLEDVTKQYMLTLHSGEVPAAVPVDMPCLIPVVAPPSAEAKPPEAAKTPDEPAPASKCYSKPQVDMRKHVTMTLLDTEQSYVESLRTLMQGYMQPLKQPENSLLCDPSLVDEIFDQIPELLEHHEQFLEQVRHCVQTWHAQQKVGDLLIQSFSKDVLVNIYSAYIDNFLNAKDAVRVAKEARPAFLKFLEQSMRENKEKQALSDLMIKPVQRIPRYELLVKDLLKHTPEDHPDHPLLLDAQRNIKQVAERINKGVRSAEEAERHARVLQEIEAHIEGMEDLQAPLRRFLRQEMVIEVKAVGGKKDRSLFLFTDLIVCTTLKRKSGSLRRSSMSLYTAASVIDTASKYKLLWKLPLEDTDIIKGASQVTNRENIQKAISRLDEDLTTLGQMSKLSESLGFPHQSLDDVLRDLSAAMHRDLSEKQALCYALSFPPTKLELCTTRPEGTDSFIFEFPHPDARLGFEQAFDEAKRKLASSKSCLDPEFLKAIPIMKTRSGMQFSCAAPTLSSCPEPTPEVWVCNSDGYVGQVCLLSLRAEPDVEACIAVCSARILCIGAVPGLQPCSHRSEIPTPSLQGRPQELAPEPAGPELDAEASEEEAATLAEPGPQACLHISIAGSGLEMAPGLPESDARPELVPFDSDSDDESSPSPSGTLQSQASRSTISSSFGNEETPSSKEATAETTSSEEEQEPGFLPLSGSFGPGGPCSTSPMDGRALRRSSRGSFTRGSLEDLLSVDPEAYQSSVWLGTEDGCVHVYQSSESIRDRRNSMKLQHASSVTCILYLNNQVFVSLANGELVVYQREAGRFWDPHNFKSVTLGVQGSTITKMVSVGGRLWCGCQNRVLVLSPDTLQLEHTLCVGQDSSRSVACMVDSSLGVWVTLKGSAHVCLYHPDTFEQLAEVDVTPPVHRMLAGSDAIIRQHKAACLRITALLVCEELLWVGTSAGVVLTMPTSPSTVSCPRAPLSPTGLGQGHTGHVRFLAAVQLPDGFNLLCPTPTPPPDTGPEKLPSLEHQDSPRHRGPPSTRPKMLVISGGDGYEDFRLSSGGSSETVGRDDSTNHLLLWRV